MEDKETVVIDVQLDAEGVAEKLAAVNAEIASVKAENAKMRKEVKEGTKTWKDVSGQMAVNEQRLKALTASQKALTGQYNATMNTVKRYGDSLKEMSAELAAMKNEYQSLTKAERESAQGQELLKHIQELDAAVKEADYSQGNFQRNVGNYPDAVKPVTAQLREMTQELIRLRMEGKANTEEYNELLQKTGEMKDAMADAQAEVKQMASDTGALNSVLDAGKLAAGAFSAALGVMTLLGEKDSKTAKELAEAQAKLQAAIAITTGLQAVQNALQKESALMMGVSRLRILAATAAQKLYAAATRDATAAQNVFNKVAKSNVYVWLAGIIISVVGAIAAFTRGSKEQEEQLKEVNRELDSQLKILQYLNGAYRDLNSQALDTQQKYIQYLKDTGASLSVIRKQEDEYYRSRLADLQEEQKKLGLTVNQVNQWELAYSNGLRNIEELEKVRRQAMKEGDEEGRIYAENEISRIKAINDEMKGKIDLYRQYDRQIIDTQREQEVANRQREEEDRRRAQEEAERRRRAYEDYVAKLRQAREATKEALKDIGSLYAVTIDDVERRLDEAFTKAEDDAVNALGERLKGDTFAKQVADDMGDLDEFASKLERQSNPLYGFSQSYKENAESIEETSSALQTSFSSLSSMYQAMARDESKTEEERERAARKAKAWAKMQIAANAGTAVAKGVASAVDVGFPAAIPAILTMTSAIIATIAQAKALASEGFETGGVIGGYRGATLGRDNTAVTARKGEMVINAQQQRQLFEIANGGGATGGMYSALAQALAGMPAPVLVYSEFRRFTDRVATLDDAAKLK